ncbi:TetR/AcrR family transcriptional regulator [Falsirhodobacter sp. 1013]|uniref:TetR/AcrR family transcriptional regulator n=1 Tax=Falsirhodobacter sp. 1013 TaxID=3417566 RepID=UPI003EBF78CD
MDIAAPRGRPLVLEPAERRSRILAAAEAAFLAKEYAATSMNDIVAACGMSKKTVYQVFATKEQLFAEVVGATIQEFPHFGVSVESDLDGEASLRAVLEAMASFILSPRHIALLRLVLSESPLSPELGAIFFEESVRHGHTTLVGILSRLMPAHSDEWAVDHLVDFLVGGLLGHEFFMVAMGHSAPPSQENIRQRVDRILAVLQPVLRPLFE